MHVDAELARVKSEAFNIFKTTIKQKPMFKLNIGFFNQAHRFTLSVGFRFAQPNLRYFPIASLANRCFIGPKLSTNDSPTPRISFLTGFAPSNSLLKAQLNKRHLLGLDSYQALQVDGLYVQHRQ